MFPDFRFKLVPSLSLQQNNSNSQVPKLKAICSNNKILDKRYNDLKRWLMERKYNGKLISSRTFLKRPS